MAGEWLAIDIGLPDKPEVQELIDLTGQPVEYVCFRLYRLWSWAAVHCADGTARMTVPRLARTCGGDEAFWRAVAAVGWLEIDETAATVAVPGWDRRFSQAAKARLQHQDRAKAQNERDPDRRKRSGTACAQAQPPAAPPRSRGEERREEDPPPPREASPPDPASWATLRAAWNDGAGQDARRRPWKPLQPPPEAVERMAEPGWMAEALEAIPRLVGCRYFKSWVGLPQFCGKPCFARKVIDGSYDDVNEPKPGPRGLDERRPAAEAAAEWQRKAEDPEAARRRAEYLESKARKAKTRAEQEVGRVDGDFEAAREAVLQSLRGVPS
jgi:hypothetical protein